MFTHNIRAVAHTVEWWKKEFGITVSTHSGKMTGIPSLSTSCTNNHRCAHWQACKGSICAKCYAQNYQSFRDTLRNAMIKNGEVLKSRLFAQFELPVLNSAYFRIESFGDLDDEENGGITQARNYLRLARKNPQTHFGWWTKNPDILDKAIELEYGTVRAKVKRMLKNITFVVSSIFINDVRDVSAYWWVNVVFTVYSKDYLEAHKEIKINCGTRQCLACLRCYTAHRGLIYVNELLK